LWPRLEPSAIASKIPQAVATVKFVSRVVVSQTSRVLPSGFAHPHASEQARRIAQRGLILRVQVGSGVHGTAVSGQDDRDEMGVCLEPPEYVTGIARVPSGVDGDGPQVPFEQYERHTAWDRPGGLANRSGAGDLDVIVYSARKWARLALAGNPTVLLVLFVPDVEVVHRDEVGAELVANAHRFVSRYAPRTVPGLPAGPEGSHARPGRRPHQPP
jgi:hypothetical protein